MASDPIETTARRARSAPGVTARVGMVGGGQLARMTQQAAIALGVELVPLATAPDESAAAVAPATRIGSPDDLEALRALAAECDVITFDHEHVPHDHLVELEREGFAVRPGAEAKQFAQDKLHARTEFERAGFAVPDFAPVSGPDEARVFGERWGWPLVLKATRGGYDGKGVLMADEAELDQVFPSRGEWIAERRIPLRQELSQMIVRGVDGDLVAYPLIETVQRDGICVRALAPAPVPDALAGQCRELGEAIAERIGLVGVMAVELFVEETGELLINELALRPHNSGHLTIEGCATSQFENHLRAVLGWPLGETTLRAPAAVMANVLGAPETDLARGLPRVLAVPDAHPHLYGKEVRAGRKIGHVTALGPTLDAAEDNARRCAAILETGGEA
ncbi:5-(carboxyamino)imidazole ribonucleotide synthase [Thermoleophilia bacterium SCSIO 60948]|nr:5-(carboxyamino)imidazole ribonucleotide synthase [Thermoleophilia bacterium SCSIO 60948]